MTEFVAFANVIATVVVDPLCVTVCRVEVLLIVITSRPGFVRPLSILISVPANACVTTYSPIVAVETINPVESKYLLAYKSPTKLPPPLTFNAPELGSPPGVVSASTKLPNFAAPQVPKVAKLGVYAPAGPSITLVL